MALTASFTSYPVSGTPVSLDFHVVVEFSSAIDPTTLVGSDFRLRSQLATFHNPSDSQVDFYTDDNTTFLVVFHFTGNLGGSQQYLIRLPMNRIQYEDEDGVTQNGPDSTINTPLFNIDPAQSLTATITYADSEGEAGTATTATLTLNQPVSGVTLSDFSIADGTLGASLTEVSSSEYEIDVTPSASGDGTMTLTFAEDGTYEGNPEASADLAYTGSGAANNAPAFQDASYSFSDVAIAVNTVVGMVAATDADDDTLSYSLTGTDASNFAIDSDGEITVATALTNSTTYNFNVVADDQTDTTSVAVTVTAIAAVAALSFGVSTISNQAWVVGTDVDLTLPEATGGTGARVYSLTPTLPQGTAFTAGTRALGGIPTAVFVSTTFTYTATDEDGNTVELTFTVAVAVAPPSLHNTFIFRDCVNYRNNGGRVAEHGNASNVIRAVADNDRETFSTETDYAVDIAVDSLPTRVDAFYLVSKGVDTHAGTPTGGTGTGWTARTVPASVDNIRGESVSTVVDGLQYDLFLLDTHFTAESVRLQFTGTGVEIYEVMLLEIVQEINATYSDFLAFDAEQVNRTGRVERSPIGGLSVVDSTREKRDVEMTVYIRPSGRTLIQSPDEFLYLLEANPRLTLAESFSENPSLLYPAIVGSLEIPVPYHSNYKPLGYDMTVLIRER